MGSFYPQDDTVRAFDEQGKAAFAAGDGVGMHAAHEDAVKHVASTQPDKIALLLKRGALGIVAIPLSRDSINAAMGEFLADETVAVTGNQ